SKQSMIDMKLRLFEKLINKPGEDFILKTEWGEIVFNTKAKGVDTTGKPLPGFEVDEGDLYLSATVRPFPKEDAQNIDFGGKEFDVALVNGDILTKEQQEVWIDVLGIAASVMDINDQSNQSLKEDLRRNLIYRLRQEGMNRRLGETEAQTQAEALVNNILNNPRIQIKIWKQSIGRRGGHIGVSSRYEKTDASGVTKEYAEYGMIYLSPSLKDHKNGMLIGLLHELGAVLRLTDAENVKFGADDKKLAEIAMILAERAKDPNNIYTEEVKPADPRRDMAMMLPASYRNTFEDELEAAVQAVKALGDNLELEKVNVIINAILNMKFEVYFKSDKAEKAQLLAEMNAMERLKLIRGVAITILEGKDNMNPEQLDGLSSVPGMVFIFLNRIMESENVKEMMAKEDKKLVERVLLKKDIEALVHEAEKLPANKPGDPDIGSYARQINPEVNNNQDLRDGLSELLDAIELQKRRAEREGLPIPLEYDNVINKIRPLLAKLQTGERGARDMAMTLPAVVDPELLQAFNGARVKIDRWIQQMGDSFTAASEAWLKWSDGVKKGTIKVDAHTLGNITEIEGRVKIAKQAADELTSLMGSFNGRDNLNREEMEQVYWAWGALHDASRKLLEFMEDSNRTPDDDRPVGLIANWDQNTKNHPEFMPLASFSKVIDENFFTLNEAFVSQGNRGDGDRAMTKDEGVYNIDVIDSGVYIMKVEGKNCIRVAPKMAPLTKTNLPAVKQAFIDLTKRVFEAAHKGLFNSEPLFQAISIGDLLKDKDRSSEAQNLATQVKSALQKGVVKMKIGNITYMIFDETDDKQVKSVLVGVDKVSKALIKLWTDKGIVSKTPTEKEMAMINEKLKSRIIIAAYADAVKDQFKDIKDKAFMLSLTRDPNEEIAVTPIGKVGEAGLAMFSHFEKEEKRAIDATSVTGDEMGTSRELVAKALLAISGIEDIGTILAMAAQILANGDLRKMSGLLFIQVRPIDINILKEISEAEREVLRAL
ncbi:MAG TPA: hypothetical protein PKG81_06185, partial [Candidatus Omnitrophota bacterium]|nr:hypothetical protein [Candidatus Omnitrophota bacterium]